MKKLLTIILTVLMALCLAACAKGSVKDVYGEWEIVKIEDPSGQISQEILDAMIPALKEQGQLFTLTLGKDASYMHSYGEDYRIEMDFENGLIKDVDYGQDVKFEYKNGQIIVIEEQSGYKFYMEKVS